VGYGNQHAYRLKNVATARSIIDSRNSPVGGSAMPVIAGQKNCLKYKKYTRGVSTGLSGPSWSVTPTQREKLTYCPCTSSEPSSQIPAARAGHHVWLSKKPAIFAGLSIKTTATSRPQLRRELRAESSPAPTGTRPRWVGTRVRVPVYLLEGSGLAKRLLS